MPATTTRNTMRECVARGVALLNAHRPDWRECIDPVRLDMTDAHRCILGQVYDDGPFAVKSGYAIGANALGLRDEIKIVDGRMIDLLEWHGFHSARCDSFDALASEWVRQLA